MTERKLASVQIVTDVTSIPNADAIETLSILGWKVVSQKGNFKPGDKCIYFEIDSFLPLDNPLFEFLASRGEKTIDGVRGHVLRTAKLRGQVSQGLALPFNAFDGTELSLLRDFYFPGDDVSAQLGVTKYEPPIPANLSGAVVGPFPTQFAPKTDAERVQNLVEVFDTIRSESDWIATEKIDGTSVTYINDDDVLRVCSRNLELKNTGQLQWQIAERYNLMSCMLPGMVVQGELYGEGIQGNPLGIKGQALAVFGVYMNRVPVRRDTWPKELIKIAAPVYPIKLSNTVDEAVAQADGIKSLTSSGRYAEGIVWHSVEGTRFNELDGRACFKVISNKFLLKQKD